MIETAGFAKPASLPLLAPLVVSSAADFATTAAVGSADVLTSGVGGGVDVTLTGEKLGSGALEDLDIGVQICAQACTPLAAGPTSLTCRTGEMMTPSTLFLEQFPKVETGNLGVAA